MTWRPGSYLSRLRGRSTRKARRVGRYLGTLRQRLCGTPAPTLPRKRGRGRREIGVLAEDGALSLSYLSRLRGRSTRKARRVGEISRHTQAAIMRRHPHPDPPLRAGEGAVNSARPQTGRSR
jgi:hypothetical protein